LIEELTGKTTWKTKNNSVNNKVVLEKQDLVIRTDLRILRMKVPIVTCSGGGNTMKATVAE
jgi:hypothetical protein